MPYITTIARKTPAIPIHGVASITPATLGPTTREKFGAIVFIAAALRVSFGPTISISSDCRDGMLNENATPWIKPSAPRCQTSIKLNTLRTARASAPAIRMACATKMTVLRGNRSATTPPSGASTSIGRPPRLVTTPSAVAEPESVSAA
jgi:hypothetical protein